MRRGRALVQLCGVHLQGCTQVHAPASSALVDSTGCISTAGCQTKQEPPYWPQTSRLPLLRSFASSSIATTTTPGHQTAASVLQQVQVLKLREHLDDESERSVHIPYRKFVELAKSIGAALDDKEAEEVAAALHRAGVILRQHDTIYLRPDEIAEMITQLLPGGKEDAQQKLAAIEAELADMDLLHERLDRTANRATSIILMTGCCVLATQLALFIWLTWWELSWDVMEPFGYVISLFYSLVGYMYFMVTRGHVFDLGPFKEKWHSYFKEKQKITEKFDEERYKYLLKLRDRYRRHLAHFAVKE